INVLHLRDTDKVCGPGKTILETVAHIDKAEFDLTIGLFLLNRERTNAYYDAAVDRGIPILAIRTFHQFDPSIIFKIIRIIREKNIHILHSHEYKSDLIAYAVSRIYRIPIMTTAHGWISNNKKSALYIRLQKKVLPKFDRVIAVSPLIKSQLIGSGVSPDKVSLVYNAIVVEDYNPSNVEPGYLRKKFNLPDNSILIGNVGRLSPEKGQIQFIKAATEVLNKHPECFFVLIGDGPSREMLENECKNLKLVEKIIFTGHEADVRKVYKDLDIVALTSYTEGFPNVMLEALCMGKPVLATDVGGTSDIVINNHTGILIPARDPDAIAKGLLKILKDPDWAKKTVKNGREMIEEKYKFSIRVNKLENLYDQIRGSGD
ncbi:MAG: glycosyltransferase family 4 protein, partial [Desulfobacteraceae bacterium]|nr:glycosyltransferase family 4 protein [Desulfobacteraceae bacterium]